VIALTGHLPPYPQAAVDAMSNSDNDQLLMRTTPLERSAQSLCMACGLCCDGTLFGHVDLKPEDKIATLRACRIQILLDKNPLAFKQPCAAYKNCTCTIYADRPRNCRDFQCVLLKRFKANAISQTEALKLIRDAISLRDDVKRNILATFGENNWALAEFTLRLKAKWKDASVGAKGRYAELFRRFVALQLCLDKSFRKSPLIHLSNRSTAGN
jgi:uncharacterized protein